MGDRGFFFQDELEDQARIEKHRKWVDDNWQIIIQFESKVEKRLFDSG
jgi:hypothetical protein